MDSRLPRSAGTTRLPHARLIGRGSSQFISRVFANISVSCSQKTVEGFCCRMINNFMEKIYHIHHIIPKHVGGSDSEDNLTKLTIEEHAEAHRVLYETFHKLEDYVAWKGLSGEGFTPEHISMLTKQALSHIKTTPEFKERMRKNAKSMWQKPGMREHLIQKRKEQINPMKGKKQKRACCIKCHNEFGVNALFNHQIKCFR